MGPLVPGIKPNVEYLFYVSLANILFWENHNSLGFSVVLYICVVLSPLHSPFLFKISIFRDIAKMIGVTLPNLPTSKYFYIRGVKNVPRSRFSFLNPTHLTQTYYFSSYSNHISQMKEVYKI